MGLFEACFYDDGDDDRCYITATFTSEGDIHEDFAIALLPLLYEHQLTTLLDRQAEELAHSVDSWMKFYKSRFDEPLQSLPPVPPLNLPTPDVPLVLSSKTVLLSDRSGYAVNFFPKFEVRCNEDSTIARFLWALLFWAVAHMPSDGFRILALSQIDLLCTGFSKGPRALSTSPLRASDRWERIAELGWPTP